MLNIPIYILKHIHYMFTLHNQFILLAENMPLMIYIFFFTGTFLWETIKEFKLWPKTALKLPETAVARTP